MKNKLKGKSKAFPSVMIDYHLLYFVEKKMKSIVDCMPCYNHHP